MNSSLWQTPENQVGSRRAGRHKPCGLRSVPATGALTLMFLWAAPTLAQTEPEHPNAAAIAANVITSPVGPMLTLNDAIARALGDQPSVAAFEREAVASEQAAIAARTLPDPQLTVGTQNLPVTGGMAFNPSADFMTMHTIGIMREQVRRSKREAAAAQLRAEAAVSRKEATVQERRIQRDVMVAWIDAVEAQAKQRLLDRIVEDLTVAYRVMVAGVPTGASTPVAALQMQAEIKLAEAQRSDASGQQERARARLARWIGAAAYQPLPDRIPALALPPGVENAADLANHPQIRLAEAQEAAAERQVDVARRDRRPDVTWSVMYGWRPQFGDMVTAQVTIPLQINRSRLQDRRVAEASARADAARLRAEDAKRELGGTYGESLADYKAAGAQLSILTTQAIPSLEASFDAAEARYGAGEGTLELPLSLVRRYVETTIQSLEQQARRARATAELTYLTQDMAK